MKVQSKIKIQIKKLSKIEDLQLYSRLREYVRNNKIFSQKDWLIKKKNVPKDLKNEEVQMMYQTKVPLIYTRISMTFLRAKIYLRNQ